MGCGLQAPQKKAAAQQNQQQPPSNLRDSTKLLGKMGFEVQAPLDAPVTGALTATFTAPVTDNASAAETAGTAQVTVGGVERSLSSQAILHAYDATDLTYVVLYDANAPDFYVVIAAHAADLTDGAVLPLNNEGATAIVVDETGGSGQLSQGGTLTVVHADLQAGGTLEASLSTDLVDVTLDAWPENLLPLTEDGTPAERAVVTGQGSFTAIYTTGRPDAPGGTSTVTVDIVGLPSVATSVASAFPMDDNQPITAILLQDPAGAQRGLVIAVPTASLTAGAQITLGSLEAGAWIFEEDGTQVAVAAGVLNVTAASLTEGGEISGSVTLSGNGYVFRCGEGSCGEPDDPVVNTCEFDAAAAQSFAPAGAAIEEAQDGLPPPYGRILWLLDADSTHGLAVLLQQDDVVEDGIEISLAPADIGGRPLPIGIWFAEGCDNPWEVTEGQLTVAPNDGTSLTGTAVFTVAGVSHTVEFSVGVETAPSGVPAE